MTKNRARKQSTRKHAAETGTSYTEARRQTMTELERMKQAVELGRVDRANKYIEQCVSPVVLRNLVNYLTAEQSHNPASEELVGTAGDRIKLLEKDV